MLSSWGCCDALWQVRSKALIQYTAPFISVNLRTMATAFGTDVGCAFADGPILKKLRDQAVGAWDGCR